MSVHLAVCNVLSFLFTFGTCNGGNPPFLVLGKNSGYVIIHEDFPLGQSLFTIKATDTDSKHVDIKIDPKSQETAELVKLGKVHRHGNTWSVDVLLKTGLDRDRNPTKRVLHFIVQDEETKMPAKLRLYIRDVNDNPPSFLEHHYSLILPERAPVGQKVFIFTTTDPDNGPGGAASYTVTAREEGADLVYNTTFVLRNKMRGELFLEQPLDYETRPHYQYLLHAQDIDRDYCPGPRCKCRLTEPNVTCEGKPASFVVLVGDVQDTPPVFQRLPYVTSVLENTTVGASIFQVSARDGDRENPNDVTYSVVQGSSTTTALTACVTSCVGVADGVYHSCDGCSSYVTCSGGVMVDSRRCHSLEVWDDVLKACSTTSSTCSHSTSSITDTDATTIFAIDNTSGVITLTSHPEADRPGGAYYSLIVAASESVRPGTTHLGPNAATTQVFISVTDVNDNRPTFREATYKVHVLENSARGMPLALLPPIHVADKDQGANSRFSLSVETMQGTLYPVFHTLPPAGAVVQGSADVIIRVNDSTVLDYETTRQITFKLIAQETSTAERRAGHATVTVRLVDTNDNSPRFRPGSPEAMNVSRLAGRRDLTVHFLATDADSGQYGTVAYSLMKHPDAMFLIHRTSGLLVNVRPLVVASTRVYSLVVVATDNMAGQEADRRQALHNFVVTVT